MLRLYDVSFIEFNGLNAHGLHDVPLPGAVGPAVLQAAAPAATQLAEVGFLLRNGEFIPAARSRPTPFPPHGPSAHGGHAGLYVDGRSRVEEIGNVWDQERILHERRRPQLRPKLRIAAFGWSSAALGHEGAPARFLAELAAGQCSAGYEAHVFTPASPALAEDRDIDGVHYHPLAVQTDGSRAGAGAGVRPRRREALADHPPFDLFHFHEWMSVLGFPRPAGRAALLSLSSVEATRRNGAAATDESFTIEAAEREAATAADFVLTPDWLRERAAAELGVDGGRVRAFPMEGRLPNEWEAPLDFGHAKMEIGVGPLDRLVLFVGPLEHAAGVDLSGRGVAGPVAAGGKLRLAFVGMGGMHGDLEQRAGQLGVGHAVRLLGHVEEAAVDAAPAGRGSAGAAVALPMPFDDAVVDLARRAGRPVVTTHGGPAHLVRHEENGVITYDNPGSMVWALDRVLGDPGHAEQMGRNGRRNGGAAPIWDDVARHYLDLCMGLFPELTEDGLVRRRPGDSARFRAGTKRK